MMFKELKPRKAKYGFETNIGKWNIFTVGQLVNPVMQGIADGKGDKDDKWFFDFRYSYGTNTLVVYINDEELYEKFKAANDNS